MYVTKNKVNDVEEELVIRKVIMRKTREQLMLEARGRTIQHQDN